MPVFFNSSNLNSLPIEKAINPSATSDTRERALLIELCDKNNVDLVFSGHWHSGGRYNFGNFTEFCFKSFCENRDDENQWTYVRLNENSQNIQFENYLVKNGKLKVSTVNYRY